MVLEILARVLTTTMVLSLALALAHRVTGYANTTGTVRKRLTLVQNAYLLLALLAFLVEAGSYIHSRAGGPPAFSWARALVGLNAWAFASWLLPGSLLIFTFVWFMNVPWQTFQGIGAAVDAVKSDPEGLTDGVHMQQLSSRVSDLKKTFPPGLGFLCTGLQQRISEASGDLSQDALLRRAAAFLNKNRRAEALHCLMRWNAAATETLLLATDCRDWKECIRLVDGCASSVLRIEAGQLMADLQGGGEYRDFAMSILDGEDCKRRRAVLEHRRGDTKRAAQLLYDDWEARTWVRDEETRSSGQRES